MSNDLISREALKKKLSGKEYITYTYEYGDAIPVEWVMNAIDNAPTVEPKQGEWIEENSETGALGIKYTWFRCNQCGWNSSLVIPRNFCPNCGTKMKGEEE